MFCLPVSLCCVSKNDTKFLEISFILLYVSEKILHDEIVQLSI